MKGPPVMLNKRRDADYSSAFSIAFIVLLVLVLLALLFDFWFANSYYLVDVSGPSMENTVQNGDILYAKRDFSAKRGDIVIIDVSEHPDFRASDDSAQEHNIIKRLIGIAGDKIKCESGVLYRAVEGGEYEPLEEPYAKGFTESFAEVVLCEGEIFVMGDNRTVSKDSRRCSIPLTEAEIVGVVPKWSVQYKETIGSWENFRFRLNSGWRSLFA